MLPYIVVDASVAGAWLFAETFSLQAQVVLDAIDARRVTALAPDRFLEELLRVCQKKTAPIAQGGAAVPPADAWLQFLDVATSSLLFVRSSELHERAWELAAAAGLTTHDALYLAVAERWGAELWTCDARLAGPAAGMYAAVRESSIASVPVPIETGNAALHLMIPATRHRPS